MVSTAAIKPRNTTGVTVRSSVGQLLKAFSTLLLPPFFLYPTGLPPSEHLNSETFSNTTLHRADHLNTISHFFNNTSESNLLTIKNGLE